MKKLAIIAIISVTFTTPSLALDQTEPVSSVTYKPGVTVTYDKSDENHKLHTPQQQTQGSKKPKVASIQNSNQYNAAILDVLKQQLNEYKKHIAHTNDIYQSITGTRPDATVQNGNDLLLTRQEFIYLRDNQLNLNSKIADLKEQIRRTENYSSASFIKDTRRSTPERRRFAAVVGKAISLRGFQEAENRVQEISKILQKINAMIDLKSMTELQLRMQGMLATIRNESTKLQAALYLHNSEKDLINQSKYERNLKILNSQNTEMPVIKYVRATQ